MRRPSIAIVALCALLAACGEPAVDGSDDPVAEGAVPATVPAAPARPIVGAAPPPFTAAYPATRRVEQVDEQFGVAVADPYRWLEAEVRESPEVAAWVEAQNALTFGYLGRLPAREHIRARMTELWNYEKIGVPVHRGDRYFFRRNDGLQNQSVLYVQDGLAGMPRVLLDPNGWSGDGADALADVVPDPAGRRVLYSVQVGGSDWRTLKVLDVDSGQLHADTIEWVKYSKLAWAADGSGFYYARFPEPAAEGKYTALTYNHAVYFHRLGTDQAEDRLVYSRPEHPKQQFGIEVTDDGRWLVLTVSTTTDDRFEVVVQDLSTPGAAARVLIAGFENNYDLAGAEGKVLFFRTNRGAARQRVVAIDTEAAAETNWREVLPEAAATLTDARLVGGALIAEYLEDAHSVVRLFAPDGTPQGEVALPGVGTAEGFDSEQASSETFFAYTSFDSPTTIYRLDLTRRETSVFRRPATPFDPALYQVRQEFYTSKDGTRVPMFIAHRRDLDTTRPAPAILYGYGGFNIPITPAFSVRILGWMEMGGIWVSANLRGGGEYGKAWHDAGRLLRKQNVFDDCIAAAEHLVTRGLTTPAQLALHGGSNGGLLVGAVINQRPDLFAVALPAVGVMDMLRFDRFSAGRYWVDDYGVPAEETHFRNLLGYSPYHNIRDGVDYPAVLVTTADTDDRVVPAHSFKYIAALQAAKAGDRPHLIRIETRAGHGSGKPTDKQIAEAVDTWAFAAAHTGLVVPSR